MAKIQNTSGTAIVDRNVNGTLWTINAFETKEIPDDVAKVLLKVYGFLAEVYNDPSGSRETQSQPAFSGTATVVDTSSTETVSTEWDAEDDTDVEEVLQKGETQADEVTDEVVADEEPAGEVKPRRRSRTKKE